MQTPRKNPFLSNPVDTAPATDPLKIPLLLLAILLGLASLASFFFLDSKQTTAIPAKQEGSPGAPTPGQASTSGKPTVLPSPAVSARAATSPTQVIVTVRPTTAQTSGILPTIVPTAAANPTQPPPVLSYSPDTSIQQSPDGTAQLFNSRLGFSFGYNAASAYVIECQQVGETSDTTSYFLIDLSKPNRPQKCPVTGLVEDLYVSRKEDIDGIITIPTYTLKKNQLLAGNPTMSVAGEDGTTVAGVSGTRLRLNGAAATPDGPNNRVYLTRNSVLFILSPRLVEQTSGFSFQ